MASKLTQDQRQIALEAIRKKLIGKKLTYEEYFAIIDQIAHGGVGDVVTTYFAAAGFTNRFSNQELYYLTKAMVETGDQLRFSGIVADKHCVGGIPGYRTTPVIVPIIAAAGLKIPKTSSRAITSPAGTADVMEVLAPVAFSPLEIKKMVAEVGGCMVWGGTVHLAPAEDELIEAGRAISFESYDKIVAAVMAKKIAAGATHLLIDLPYGPQAKINSRSDAEFIERKFRFIARQFGITLHVEKALIDYPIGQGVGPLLEARDCLRILQQKKNRPLVLEKRALKLSASLLHLCGQKRSLAKKLLISGQAFEKMQAIIKAQKGNSQVDSEDLRPGKMGSKVISQQSGQVKEILNKSISRLCRLLGTPADKKAGLYLRKKIGDQVEKGEVLLNLYSSAKIRLEKAKEVLKKGLRVYIIEEDV